MVLNFDWSNSITWLAHYHIMGIVVVTTALRFSFLIGCPDDVDLRHCVWIPIASKGIDYELCNRESVTSF